MTDHAYEPAPWTAAEERRWRRSYARWEDMPSELRYSACVCGRPWADHLPNISPPNDEPDEDVGP